MSQVEAHPISFREMLMALEACFERAAASIPMSQAVVAIGLVQTVEATEVVQMIVVAQQEWERLPLSMDFRRRGRTSWQDLRDLQNSSYRKSTDLRPCFQCLGGLPHPAKYLGANRSTFVRVGTSCCLNTSTKRSLGIYCLD